MVTVDLRTTNTDCVLYFLSMFILNGKFVFRFFEYIKNTERGSSSDVTASQTESRDHYVGLDSKLYSIRMTRLNKNKKCTFTSNKY